MTNELIETKAFKGMTWYLTGHNDFQFALGGIYEIAPEKEIKPCKSGFHACINLVDCFEYYNDHQSHRFFEVTIFGDYETKESVICGRKIRIDKEIILAEYLNGEYIDYYGTKNYYKNGELHRDDDLPAEIRLDGTQWFYKNDMRHRDGDLPAVIKPDGSKYYYKNNKLHRDGDLPAVIDSDGSLLYYKNGQLHHDGDLPAVIRPTGIQEYYKNGKRHRNGDLPAIIKSDGTQIYYKNGKLHRDGDLHATIKPDGTKGYYVNGIEYTP